MKRGVGGERRARSSNRNGGPAPRAVGLQQLVEALDVVNPRARTAVRQLSQIREGRRADLERMLTLQVLPDDDARDPKFAAEYAGLADSY